MKDFRPASEVDRVKVPILSMGEVADKYGSDIESYLRGCGGDSACGTAWHFKEEGDFLLCVTEMNLVLETIPNIEFREGVYKVVKK